jgi:hypothetical protein
MGCSASKVAPTNNYGVEPELGPNQKQHRVNYHGKQHKTFNWTAPEGYQIEDVDHINYVTLSNGGDLSQDDNLRAGMDVDDSNNSSQSNHSQWSAGGGFRAGVTGIGGAELGANASRGGASGHASRRSVRVRTNVDVAKFTYTGLSNRSTAIGYIIFTLKWNGDPAADPARAAEREEAERKRLAQEEAAAEREEAAARERRRLEAAHPAIVLKRLSDPKLVLSPDQSLECIGHCTSVGSTRAQQADGRRANIFVGNTGSGKSTTANYILGCEMEVVSKASLGIKKLGDVVRVKKGSRVREQATIGHENKSKTWLPEILFSVLGKEEEPVLIDCPGFLDNRGS